MVTGGAGFLGRAVCSVLAERGVASPFIPRRKDYDLTREADVARAFRDFRPEVVLHLAAEVGGIGANRQNPGRYFFANMAMALHLVEHARLQGVRKFVQVGTVCSYPKHAPVPFAEESLWDGYPEETNAPYGVAKKAALVMLDAYRRQYGLPCAYVVPVNLYGPWDNFDRQTSHVIPALVRRFLEAKESGRREVVCWGSGRATREFLFVEDAAEGIVRAAERMDDPLPINLGTGVEVAIQDLARSIAKAVGFEGSITWDGSFPDGQPRRRLDVARARDRLGWSASVSLDDGLQQTVAWYLRHRSYRADFDPSLGGA